MNRLIPIHVPNRRTPITMGAGRALCLALGLLLAAIAIQPASRASAAEVNTELNTEVNAEENAEEKADSKTPPNIVIIFADDLGYGDLGCYGHPSIRTPNLDQMAREGTRFTDFYSAATVCTPSRAALLTGRYPIRSGMAGAKRRVLFPGSKGGLPESEITLAEALRKAGYATTCIGKWHLGDHEPYMPLDHGFDTYFGLPYSNDMRPRPGAAQPTKVPLLPLYHDREVIQRSPDQGKLSERYTQQAIDFIRACTTEADGPRPFFVYLPHTMPHVPLYASQRFAGTSQRGLYGDVVETIDWGVGQIMKTLRETGVDKNTVVFFTSDNGPWLIKGDHGGSAGLLRGGKGSTWEGGMREPAIAWGPGIVRTGAVTSAMASTMDLYTTCIRLASAELPQDREIDGVDLMPILRASHKSTSGSPPQEPRDSFVYYRGTDAMAVRKGPWKMHLRSQAGYGQQKPDVHDPPLLYHLGVDPSEKHDLGDKNPDVIAQLRAVLEAHQSTLNPLPAQY